MGVFPRSHTSATTTTSRTPPATNAPSLRCGRSLGAATAGSSRRSHRHNRSNQPVATLRNRLEQVWRFGVIAESLAQFGDGPGQRGLAHHSRAPEVIEQPFFGHDFTRVGRQVGEQIHDLCPHLDDPTGARQAALVRLHQPVAHTELAAHGLAQYAPFPGWRLSDCRDSTER